MRCEQFEQRMQALLDRRLIPERDPLLLRHAHCCERCAMMIRAETELAEYLADTSAAALDDTFTAAVMARLAPATKHSRPRFSRRLRFGWRMGRVAASFGAAAAALLLCLLPLLVPDSDPGLPGAGGSGVVRSDGHRVRSEATQGTLADGQATRKLMTLASQKLDGADDIAVTVAGDLEPWARSIGSAFAALRQAWPGRSRPSHETGRPMER